MDVSSTLPAERTNRGSTNPRGRDDGGRDAAPASLQEQGRDFDCCSRKKQQNSNGKEMESMKNG